MGRNIRPFFCGLIFTLSLTLGACGKPKDSNGDLTSADDPGGEISGETSDTGYDAGGSTDAVKKGLDTIAGQNPTAETKEAIEQTKPFLTQFGDLTGLFRTLGVDEKVSPAQVIRELSRMRERSEFVSAMLRRANQEALAILVDQLGNMKPVVRIRDVRSAANIRMYYTSDPNRVTQLQKTLGKRRFRNDGIAFMVWVTDKPVREGFYVNIPQIETKPLYGCPVRAGGTFVTNDINCERRRGITASASLLGYTSKTSDIKELEIQRFKHKSRRFAHLFLATVRADEKAKATLWTKEKDLGGSAVVRMLIRIVQ